jgi:hypothetical protein
MFLAIAAKSINYKIYRNFIYYKMLRQQEICTLKCMKCGLKGILEDVNKWKDIPYPWIGGQTLLR